MKTRPKSLIDILIGYVQICDILKYSFPLATFTVKVLDAYI